MTDPAINVSHVSKQFGETQVLRDISMQVEAGKVSCLIGPSGSGKSTLLRCMAFLEQATSGSIHIEGEPLGFTDGPQRRRQSPAELRRVRSRIGMVFQQFNLWPHMTALGNVAIALRKVRGMSRSDAEDRAMAQLDKVGLKERAHHYPAQLSGGQQQRVAIARALALDPTIMLFDEPTSALDPELTGEVLNVMRQLASEGMTMVVVTHEIGFAASVGNRIAFLDGGRLLFHDTPQAVFAAPREPRLEQFLDTYLDRGASMLK
ncbi:phosphate ABC transporter ATP-binding protein [Salipiger aestuarii]|uniref:Polar amino acid transport system ATP-binding protein n=1 Tax=Salipiger aestuarii TaxID=568098 RepID=A0A327YHM9_9RHOB|nr:amino acid ABC transporter ATP-binding protein [Salipiger aestuarii]EIE51470.1 ABC transporter-like protein [Citreicella sp. 357]KAA8608910.1 phosphate ABC transporter ATP-binding protein [Salipiger aestuarii]KAA8613215.1 phosphate ABC transporter ATP-binding protein [Salipiger aestuarii]KAB2543033.1 phosphate ABC transporter ATP-binding protein [Salipiger aestuarii]RAK19706.1 polar amino acid transport system ATP-binding protein [Salipiger aestuarii]